MAAGEAPANNAATPHELILEGERPLRLACAQGLDKQQRPPLLPGRARGTSEELSVLLEIYRSVKRRAGAGTCTVLYVWSKMGTCKQFDY